MYSETFRQMLNTLHHRVGDARRAGMSMEEMTELTTRIGDWLADDAEPRTDEQRLLKELWRECDQNGKRSLAQALIGLAGREQDLH